MKVIIIIFLLSLSTSLFAEVPVATEKQDKIRPSYPFPTFLSTGPYIWYENVKNKPIKGHTFRISTFSTEQSYEIFIEKVEFGNDGCCLEIIDFRQLILDKAFLQTHYPKNKGSHNFKLIRWLEPEVFEFQAFGGKYKLSQIGEQSPLLEEIEETEENIAQ
ncbi:MAG: hypothetical protein DRQ47_00980 [Gammaproteobacteria bacterium]|nr:MAG: hypothetical protein DRQ47_00980 [Gammaproteobacteria bacterium]